LQNSKFEPLMAWTSISKLNNTIFVSHYLVKLDWKILLDFHCSLHKSLFLEIMNSEIRKHLLNKKSAVNEMWLFKIIKILQTLLSGKSVCQTPVSINSRVLFFCFWKTESSLSRIQKDKSLQKEKILFLGDLILSILSG